MKRDLGKQKVWMGLEWIHYHVDWSFSNALSCSFNPYLLILGERILFDQVCLFGLKAALKKDEGLSSRPGTLPETNIARENGWLEYKPFLFGKAYFQGPTVRYSGRVILLAYGFCLIQGTRKDVPRSRTCTLTVFSWCSTLGFLGMKKPQCRGGFFH